MIDYVHNELGLPKNDEGLARTIKGISDFNNDQVRIYKTVFANLKKEYRKETDEFAAKVRSIQAELAEIIVADERDKAYRNK